MAVARIIHHWPDDDGCTVLEVEVTGEYPDALDEARLAVQRMYAETLDSTEAGE